MFRWITIGILSVLLVGIGIWGYQEHQDKDAVLVHAENGYQRAFHDLTYRIDLLNDKISTIMATNTPERLSPQMADIWKITSEAHGDVGMLPLSLLPFNKTQEFLNNIGEYSYRVAVRKLDDDPLEQKELDYLAELYEQSNEVKRDLRRVQHEVLNEGLRWMDVEMALATNEPGDNTIIDGFQTVETNAESYIEAGSQFGLTATAEDEKELKLEGEPITEEEASQFIRKHFDLDESLELNVSESMEGTDLPVYYFSFENDTHRGYAEITQQGGQVVSFILNRDIQNREISLHDGMNQAAEHLKELGFVNMEPTESMQYEKIGVYTFVRTDDDVYYQPDRIQVKVALDNGEITALSARDYLVNHYSRGDVNYEQNLTEEEAKELVNPALEVEVSKLAVIKNDLGDEVLTYEFIGQANDSTYKVYINADDGFEEGVERLKNSEQIFESS
uniref:germination protein YpeB n=1 Tax=uncultured Allobacillus sp. TaxID=1638025 RepID=UPI002598354D|nr:germination protein YpeB [uncultured Allobacillus sp.]